MTDRIRGRKLQQIRERHKRINPLCAECLKADPPVIRAWDELDHHIALAHNGTDTDDNRVGLCREHHKAKTIAEFGLTAKTATGPDGWPL
jgi:5-methylcytosine-specific restriction endonuclease McrA